MRCPGSRTRRRYPAAERAGTKPSSSFGSSTLTCTSMIGLAGRCGTAVDPMWSMRLAALPSAAAMRSRSPAKRAAQAGSPATISMVRRSTPPISSTVGSVTPATPRVERPPAVSALNARPRRATARRVARLPRRRVVLNEATASGAARIFQRSRELEQQPQPTSNQHTDLHDLRWVPFRPLGARGSPRRRCLAASVNGKRPSGAWGVCRVVVSRRT